MLVEEVALEQVFLPVLQFVPCQYNSTNVPYSPPPKYCPHQNGTRANPGTFKEAYLLQISVTTEQVAVFTQNILSLP
jgi:hypothetical protein